MSSIDQYNIAVQGIRNMPPPGQTPYLDLLPGGLELPARNFDKRRLARSSRPIMTIGQLVGVTLLLIASSGAASAAIEVQGHRGARAARPENTLPAFVYALDAGVDTLELDLSVTKDNVLVLSHDPLINPELCLDQSGKKLSQGPAIYSLTLAEVKQFDCGTLKNPRFANQQPVPGSKIPTLEELFTLVKESKAPAAKTVQFNIETKIVPRHVGSLTPGPEAFAKLVVDLVQKYGLESRIIVQSFDHRSLQAVKALNKRIRIAPLFGDTLVDVKALIQSTRPEIISPNLNWITPDVVHAAHAAGAKVIAWTANTAEEWDWLIHCGVDGIITDDPAGLIAWLKAKKIRNP